VLVRGTGGGGVSITKGNLGAKKVAQRSGQKGDCALSISCIHFALTMRMKILKDGEGFKRETPRSITWVESYYWLQGVGMNWLRITYFYDSRCWSFLGIKEMTCSRVEKLSRL